MKLYYKLTIVLLLNILVSQTSIFLDNNIREVPLFGIANSSMRYNNFDGSSIEYDFGETDFEKATECINPHVMTFPSANPCYFDWRTGWALPQDSIVEYINTLDLDYADYHNSETNGDYFFGMANEDYEWWENADGTWNPVNIDVRDFSNFIKSNNITGTFSLNMLTSSIDMTMDMVRDNYAFGVPFEYIELGSEYYLRSGGDKWDDADGDYMYDEGETLTKDKDEDGTFDPGRFEFIYPTPESFALECNKYIDSLSTILPENTKYAVSSKNKSGDPRSDDWTRQVLRHISPSLIDTIYLSWHEYLRFEKKEDDVGNQDTLTAEQVMAFPQFMHEDMITSSGMDPNTIASLEDELDINIKIWLTESAYRELGHKPWIFKWAQSLVNIQNYSLMLRNPYVEIIMLQALHGWNSTSAINHGNQFPDEVPLYVDQDSCSPYGRTATAFSIYFWNYISEGMTHMQEIIFNSDDGEHLGVILENPFDGEDADSNQSPNVDSTYSYLMGWQLYNISSGEEKAIIINVADAPKTIQYDSNVPIFNIANMRCIHITSLNNDGEPSIDQYINGDGDLNYDTTDVVSSMIIPPYSVNLFEPYISGCIDVSACNFDLEASVDDGSCIFVVDDCENCGGDCIADDNDFVTCSSIEENTNNTTIADECGVCGGSGIPDGACDCGGNTPTDLYGSDNYNCEGASLLLLNGLIPEVYSIHSLYPNPFNPVTNIIYGLPEYSKVQIDVYNLTGKQIESLVNEFQTPGYYSIKWNGNQVPSGLYICRLSHGKNTITRKMLLMK